MSALADFLPLVLPQVTGCSSLMAEQKVRLACRTFCTRTRVWRATDTVAVLAGVATPAIVVPAESTLYEVERVWFEGREIPAEAYTARNPGHTDSLVVAMKLPDQLVLKAPQDGTFEISTILQPSIDAAEVPDFLFEKFGESIAAGALADLLSMAGVAWANPQAAMIQAAKFEDALNEHTGFNVRGQQRAPLRTRVRY